MAAGSETRLECKWAEKRSVLMECIDMGPMSWAVRQALYTSFNIRGSWTFDPSHRRYDYCLNAFAASGLTLVRLEAGIAYTFSAGPWHGDAFHGTLVDGVQQWHASSSHLDPLFQLMYPHIVLDSTGGRPPLDFGSQEHQLEVWNSLPSCCGLVRQGMQIKYSRWYQFVEKTVLFAPHWSTILAVCLYVAMFKGWVSSLAEFPHLVPDLDRTEDGDGSNPVVGQVVQHPCASRGLPGNAAAAPPVRSVKHSNAALQRLRSGCANGMHLALKVLSLLETRAIMVGTCALVRPTQEAHSKAITIMKTTYGCLWWRSEMASGGQDEHLQQMWKKLYDHDLLLNMGLVDHKEGRSLCRFGSKEAKRLATSMVNFCRELMLREVEFLWSYSGDLPAKFAALVSDTEAQRVEASQWIRRAFAEVTKAERAALADAWLDTFLRELVWPRSTWCREVCVGLLEMGDEVHQLPSDLALEVRHANMGPCETKLAEDAFNLLRKASKRTGNGSLSRSARWLHCVESPLLTEHDFKAVTTAPSDSVDQGSQSGTKVESKHYEAKACVLSLGKHVREKYLKGPKDWPQLSSARYMHRSMALSALLLVEGDYQRLRRLWLSKLLMPGIVAVRQAPEQLAESWWVLGASEFGAVGIPMHLTRKKGVRVVTPKWSPGRPWHHLLVADDYASWTGFEVCATPPTVACLEHGLHGIAGEEFLGIVLTVPVSAGRLPVTTLAAKNGFATMTCEDMKSFITIAKVPVRGKRPTLEKDLATLLIQWAIPGVTQEELQSYLACRGKKATCEHSTVLSEENVDVAEGCLRTEDAHETEEIVKKAAPKKASSTAASSSAGAGSSGEAASGSGTRSAPGDTAQPVPGRPPLPAGIYSQAKAREYLPQVKGCTISIHQNTRWQVKYTMRSKPPRSWSEVWKPSEAGRDHMGNLKLCLAWAWAVHAQEQPTAPACPWDLPTVQV